MIDIRTARLLDFVPSSIADDPEIVAMSDAIDPELQDVAVATLEAIIMPRIAEQPIDVIEALGWSMNLTGLAVWTNATLQGKRDLLVEIFAVRRRSGTRWSVRRIFELLQLSATIIEWFEEGADPFTYRVLLNAGEIGVSAEQLLEIPEMLRRFAPARNKLEEISVEVDSSGPLRIYPALTRGRIVTISGGP